MKTACLALLVAIAGCSSSKPDTSTTDATSDATVIDRGPTNTVVDGDPNGLYWDMQNRILYIADQEGNQLLTWTDAGGFGTPIPLPTVPAADTLLGGLDKDEDGTLLTPRFGSGTLGGMIEITAGVATNEAGLDVTRRRLGVAVADDGTIIDTYFVKTTTTVGACAILDVVANTETDLITGLTKPVGVAAIGNTVYCGDQPNNVIYSTTTTAGASTGTVFASNVTGVDLMTPGPNGGLYTGSTVGDVYQVNSDGTFTTFQSGFNETRGVAYDSINSRLFVAEHIAGTGTTNALHIFPVSGS